MKILRRTPPPTPPLSVPLPAETVARRRVEITVEREALISSPPPSFEAFCPQCERRVLMVNPAAAARAAHVSVREIYRWVDAKKLHFLEAASGDLYLCSVSLHTPAEPNKTLPPGDSR